MYACSEKELNQSSKNITDLEEQFPKFVNRFCKFLDRGNEWLTFHSLNAITRDHNTNNICEAAIRVIKKIVLSRTRAYNVAALVEYIVDVFNKYLTRRLLKEAYNRGPTKQHLI